MICKAIKGRENLCAWPHFDGEDLFAVIFILITYELLSINKVKP